MDKRQIFTNDSGKLYLIATPIGNLEDISPRVKDTIEKVDYLACEDTRNTEKLLSFLNIKKKLVSYHKFNEKEMLPKILDDLNKGMNIGIVSDAGYPGISDPGEIASTAAIEAGFDVTCIAGPSAFIHALVCSTLPANHFYFYGFLDSKTVARRKELESLLNVKDTMIFYETSNRMNECLKDMYEVLGNRKFCVARELTKKYEEFTYGYLSEYESVETKGECVVVIEGQNEEQTQLDSNTIEVINELLEKNISGKDVARLISRVTNISKNDLYDYIVKNKK